MTFDEPDRPHPERVVTAKNKTNIDRRITGCGLDTKNEVVDPSSDGIPVILTIISTKWDWVRHFFRSALEAIAESLGSSEVTLPAVHEILIQECLPLLDRRFGEFHHRVESLLVPT